MQRGLTDEQRTELRGHLSKVILSNDLDEAIRRIDFVWLGAADDLRVGRQRIREWQQEQERHFVNVFTAARSLRDLLEIQTPVLGMTDAELERFGLTLDRLIECARGPAPRVRVPRRHRTRPAGFRCN